MNFKEEYKSAMNKISPDEQTAGRIEQAVLQKAAKPSKKKKPFYVYAGAFSGAAACIVGAILLINFNVNQSKNYMLDAGKNQAGASLCGTAKGENATPNLTASSSSTERDDILSAEGVIRDQTEQPAAPGENFDSSVNAKNEGGFDTVPEASVNPSYTLEFQPDESVVVFDGEAKKRFIPDNTVTRYYQEQRDLISAKTSDGKTVLIIFENDYLYVFENDLKTADVYKLSY